MQTPPTTPTGEPPMMPLSLPADFIPLPSRGGRRRGRYAPAPAESSVRHARTSAIHTVGAFRRMLLDHRMACMEAVAVVAVHGAACGVDLVNVSTWLTASESSISDARDAAIATLGGLGVCWKGEGNPPVNAGYTFDVILPRNGVVAGGEAVGGAVVLMANGVGSHACDRWQY
ncbi:hypothetical protein HDU96_000866 [Phlyctochytrium bullatum]|nr:hypothetical protein HDU96_000866 [Phlyctochytrium bullatum]